MCSRVIELKQFNVLELKHEADQLANWQEADQLAIYKSEQGFELGTTEKQIPLVAEWRS